MNLRELLVKIGVDDSGTTEKLDQIDRSADHVKSTIMGLGAALAGLGIGAAVKQLITLGDQLQSLQARIDNAVGGHIEGLFETISEHASQAGMDVSAYADSFSKFGNGMRRLGYDVQDTLALTDTLSGAFALNGTEAQQAAGALFQLTQSISSGSVQMEELNSFMDASPDLYNSVAESIGGNVQQFKKMVSQGKVSSKMLADAILAQNKRIMEAVSKMPTTFSKVWARIVNDAKVAFKQMVVDTGILKDAAADLRDWWNEARQSWLDFVDSMGGTKNVADSIKNVLTPLAALLTLLTGFKALSLLTSPIAAVIALAGAIGLLYDDYMVWKEGGTSLIDWSEWQTTLTQASNLVTQLTRDVNGLITSVREMLGIDVSKWSLKGEIENLVHQVHTLMNSIQGLVDTIKNISNGDFAAAAKSIQRMWNGQSFEEQMNADAAAAANPEQAAEQPGPLDRIAASPFGKMISSPMDAVVDAYNWFRTPTPAVPSPIDVSPLPNNVQADLPGGGNTGIGGVPQVTNNNDNKTINVSPSYTINVTGVDQNTGSAALQKILQDNNVTLAQGVRDAVGGH
ncbi:tape measure protein [Enterobacter kobei]|uniref:tape measure protein n=1 Tax=Enterobacter kobei TaxID=208224 RepID=UPI003B277DEA